MTDESERENPRGHRLTQEWQKGTQMISCLNCENAHVSRKNFEEYDCELPGAFARRREQKLQEVRDG